MCALTEFGRILLYNILVDGDREGPNSDSDDEDDLAQNEINFKGYKQMILILNSQEVETGKSFLAEILLRIFHGRKVGLHSTLSFESAKNCLRTGEPIVIDDYNNDNVGATLISRASKAIWGQAAVTLRNNPIVPKANIVICTNEKIRDLKVEGKNRDEIYMKFSVLDLGEEPLGNCSDKEENFKKILEMTKVIRKNLPSFLGLMLQASGKFISQDEFHQYREITKHERLANLLKNVKNVFDKLGQFCELENVVKPRSLRVLDVSSLTNKSELVLRVKTPEQLAEFLISQEIKIVLTEHKNFQGIAFEYKPFSKYPWFKQTMNFKKDGIDSFEKMRTRKLSGSGEEGIKAAFLKFEILKENTVDKLKEMCKMQEEPIEIDHEDVVTKFFEEEFKSYDTARNHRIDVAMQFIVGSVQEQNSSGSDNRSGESLVCQNCNFVAKSKTGLKNHLNRCKKK